MIIQYMISKKLKTIYTATTQNLMPQGYQKQHQAILTETILLKELLWPHCDKLEKIKTLTWAAESCGQ